VIYHFFCH